MNNNLTLTGFLPAARANSQLATPTTFVGIDFGTSTTVAAYATLTGTNQVQVDTFTTRQRTLQGSEQTDDKTPTVIAFSSKLNELYIGKGAAELKFQGRRGRNVWYSFKMELGEDSGPYADSLLNNKSGFDNITTAQEAAVVFFKYLRQQIEQQIQTLGLPSRLAWAVSIPASFEANQRRDLLAALHKAGISVPDSQCLIDEPNAAVLSILQYRQHDTDSPPIHVPDHRPLNLLVFDFGAGTCDISVLEIGLDREAFYSKNLSISRFEAIGGDNLDQAVALKLLLPQVVASGLPLDELSQRQLHEDILPQLLKAAETLKVEICRDVQFQQAAARQLSTTSSVVTALPALASSSDTKQLAEPLTVRVEGQTYTVPRPAITYAQFAKAIDPFLDECCDREELRGYSFISIFEPINSALEKAGLERDEIDYVLLVGGSAKNPYVQQVLQTAFPGTRRLLIPTDLQTHVGKGAAIHSLLLHGLGRNLIQPITGEPISVITKGGQLEPLVPAGTSIPCGTQRITNLRPQREGQQVLEVPICLGHTDRILHVIHLTAPTADGFSLHDEVEVSCTITLDKVVHVQARTANQTVQAVPLNPYANKHLSTAERAVHLAAKEVRQAAARNGGKPTAAALLRLARAYEKAASTRLAAETLREAYNLDKSVTSLNNVAVAFGNAGDRPRAIKLYEQAYAQDPSPIITMNLALNVERTDPARARRLKQEAYDKDSAEEFVLYNYALAVERENPAEYRRLLTHLVELQEPVFQAGHLSKNAHFRLHSAAGRLGRTALRDEVQAAERQLQEGDGFFNEANTLERHSVPQLST